jgi:hypothetical protein
MVYLPGGTTPTIIILRVPFAYHVKLFEISFFTNTTFAISSFRKPVF